ncbi:MAG: DUF1298 domain-containing protein [Gammaproteobacteria bacterium]|nr:DUF1298 domain-containing protein [Gammaproteobacteria bacterium]
MRLTSSDASFLYAESHSGPMHIASIYVLEGELSFERAFSHIEERIHLIPSYRRKIALVPFNMGHPKWIDDPSFDLSNHVIHHSLPNGSSFDDALDAAVTLNEPMLDRTRPLWMIYVVSGVADQTLILQITHHCMIDGASGIELSTVIYDFDANGSPVEPAKETWQPAPEPSATELFSEALTENLAATSADLSRLRDQPTDAPPLLRRALGVMTNFVSRPAITAPFNAAMVGPRRRARYLKKSFGEIREIRRALGGTINDVVLTVVSEAVARYLKAHDEAVDNQMMRIMCPVNVRTENQKGALGNRVSAIFPMLPAWPMAVKSRLALVCAETEKIKANEEAQALTMATESGPTVWPLAMAPTQLVGTALDPTALVSKIPWPIPPSMGWRPPNLGINFICTNVPGVQVPQFLAGHKVTDTIGLLILSANLGFSITILSYNKELFFSFICEPRLLPDLELVVSNANDAFEELLDTARAHALELSGGSSKEKNV